MLDEPELPEDLLDAPDEQARPRDPRTDDAKAAVLAFVETHQVEVWYERQLVVMFEQARRLRPSVSGSGFFHWIVVRALDELVEERELDSKTLPLNEPVTDAALKNANPAMAAAALKNLTRVGLSLGLGLLGEAARADQFHYNNVLVGTRSVGMGGAFGAVADDGFTIPFTLSSISSPRFVHPTVTRRARRPERPCP